MSNDIASSSDDSNNLNDEENDEENKETAATNESEVVTDRFNNLKSILIYAVFLFAKITCFILINANILFFLTYLFERIYYKKFTIGNMDKKKRMVDDYKTYLDATFPSDRTQAPFKNVKNGFKENKLLTCPIDYEKKAKEDAIKKAEAALSKKSASGPTPSFDCKTGNAGSQNCPPAAGGVAGALPPVALPGGVGALPGAAQPPAVAAQPGAGTPQAVVGAAQPAVQAGGQKGGIGANIIKNINELSKKLMEGVKPVNKVKKTIADLYAEKNNPAGDDGDDGGGEAGGDDPDLAGDIDPTDGTADPECKDTLTKRIDLMSCEKVECKGEFPYNTPTPNNMFGDYLRIRLACIGKTQIAINNKIKNRIKSFNNLLPAFCYCTKEETDYISGKDPVYLQNPKTGEYDIKFDDTLKKSEEYKKVFKEDPDAIEINCKVRNEFYNGLLMVFGFFISIFYLIYCDLYVNITLFVNHILLWSQITNRHNPHIETKNRRILKLLMFLMTPFIFITNRVIACAIMLQLTYRIWIKPLFKEASKEKVYKIITENRNIVAYIFVFSYLLFLYTLNIPANYELPVKIIPTLIVTIIVLVTVIQSLYRIITNLKFTKASCKKL
jgi:hypothetical protein